MLVPNNLRERFKNWIEIILERLLLINRFISKLIAAV